MNPSDLIDVFDEYLKRSGAGKNYIADKIFKLFNDKDSPFNSDGKLIENLKDGIKDLNKKIKDFKLPNFYAFNRAMDGALREVRNFRDNFQLPDFDALKNSILNASTVVDNFSNNFQSPSFNNFTKAMNSALKKVKDFTNKFKVSSFHAFNVAMNGALREVRTFRDNLKILNKSLGGGLGGLGIEPALGTSNIVDVRLVDISPEAQQILKSIFGGKSTTTVINQPQPKDKEEGSFIGKIIKGIIGTVAVVAGIGFLSSFLDTPVGKNIKAIMGDLKDRFVEMIKPFVKKLIDFTLVGLKTLFFELPKYFLKQTFNFFGLKEILGKENEGLAVLLTKGIYYSVKNFFFKFINNISFGLFGKLASIFKIDKLFSTGGQIGKLEKLGETISKLGSNLSAIPRYLKSITRSNVLLRAAFTVMDKTFSMLTYLPKVIFNFFSNMGFGVGKLTKGIGAIAKFGGGSILKLLGTGLKAIAKRAPIIGGLISLKDAYDRLTKGDIIGGLISIGSGIAGFMPPGIGTAIMIGLDVLNMFLDKKSEGGKIPKSKLIGDFFVSIGEKIWNTLKEIGKIILSPFTSLLKKIKGWIFGEEEEPSKQLEKGKEKPAPKSIEKNSVNVENKSTTRWDMPQRINDGIISKNKVVVPSTSDDVVMAKNGGPFDLAFKEMNNKLDSLLVVFAQGTQLIANSTIQGSSSVVQAVVSTGSKQAPVMIGGSDPIADFRERANKNVR